MRVGLKALELEYVDYNPVDDEDTYKATETQLSITNAEGIYRGDRVPETPVTIQIDNLQFCVSGEELMKAIAFIIK